MMDNERGESLVSILAKSSEAAAGNGARTERHISQQRNLLSPTSRLVSD